MKSLFSSEEDSEVVPVEVPYSCCHSPVKSSDQEDDQPPQDEGDVCKCLYSNQYTEYEAPDFKIDPFITLLPTTAKEVVPSFISTKQQDYIVPFHNPPNTSRLILYSVFLI